MEPSGCRQLDIRSLARLERVYVLYVGCLRINKIVHKGILGAEVARKAQRVDKDAVTCLSFYSSKLFIGVTPYQEPLVYPRRSHFQQEA